MKTVLCYGDSNTYGYNPMNGFRYPENIRWTGRLQSLLGSDYKVIEEGCNGRTTVFDDPLDPWKNGLPYLRPCLNTHKPIDIIILMLGSNDLKKSFSASAEEIAEGAGRLVDLIKEFTLKKQGFQPSIILVSPSEVTEEIGNSPFFGEFDFDAVERSKTFGKYYKRIADEKGCDFLNAAEIVRPSLIDALHWTEEGHAKFAEKVREKIVNYEHN
ncbi:MAG: SGNH/GDSL hydrolase family protein [Lachnospiraceae bacterium]|nr:SGNH/GDSL hydrolase family protein [Lachnospiraceae bacterium]